VAGCILHNENNKIEIERRRIIVQQKRANPFKKATIKKNSTNQEINFKYKER
jgi:hypothetical protein